MKKMIYFDNAATTKVDEKVMKEMEPYFEERYGNASSVHPFGFEAKDAIEKARGRISKKINCKTSEIVFTSGGTESNNFALKGLFFKNKEKNHIITTKVEHDCILQTCKWLEKQGAKVTYLEVDKDGFIDLEKLKDSITDKTLVVSIIHANNEIGTIHDMIEIGKICKEKGVLFHTDACQSFTKVDLDVKKMNLNLVTINSHKIHGPKGVGALYIKDGTNLETVMHGGGHERNLRSGSYNVSGIVGFGKAVDVSDKKDVKKMEKLRDVLIDGLLEIDNVSLNGPRERLCNNVNVSFNDVEGEAVGGFLENSKIYTSTGSACMSNTLKSSHVLEALGHTPLQRNSSLRISISKYTTEEEVEFFLKEIKKVIKKLRAISPLVR
ncbi:cysteine desulfurase [archaeon]|nr:cysteine desulfurase [archaeon]